ncbi:hypothetical protein [Maribacter arenosus]|uniref:Alpha/beta hydrolase family protein n=1 Tax=Maribacter arenosus TaxID=1854708 RepID=A0ABR7VEX9_9FLAO|nr:hypothetical protein [Maribacter arenosus]MBD0852220.1 hypothetical protein [Maribacter arenosus]
MKTLKSLFRFFMITILSSVIIVLFYSCEKPISDELYLEDSVSIEESLPWQDLLSQLDLGSEILFVQQDESIQDVVDAAKSGSVIYIEPGNYQEEISIDKLDLKLIGLGLTPDDLIIKNAEKSNIEIINLYDQSGFDNLQNKSFNSGKSSCLNNMTREDLGGGIAHYQFEVVMGPGEFDVVRIHRVVRESRAYKPVRTKGHVFMVHGAIQDFDDVFLTAGAETIDAKTSSSFYLASNDIDVWGIDMGWNMVPLETTDFSFMQGWGIEKDIDHALTAMSIARLIRGLTRQGFSRMNLLGFSYGVQIVYGAADRETQQHWFRRDIKGIIPVDYAFKYDNESLQATACSDADYKEYLLNSPQYQDDRGAGFMAFANLTLNAPNDPSQFNSSLTNLQFFMANTSQVFCAGNQDEFFYTDPFRFIRQTVNIAPYWPMQIFYEVSACGCPTRDVTFDDHLGEISLPILYIGSEIATGEAGIFSSSLTASTDITNHIVPGYSHSDLWLGYDADQLVWSPLRNWLKNHK